MSEEGLELAVYFGERTRAGGARLADALPAIHARHAIAASLLLRGVEGFGRKHGLRTDRLLTLSEDLPLVSVAVDARSRIEAALRDVEALGAGGLVTLQPAQLLTGDPGPPQSARHEAVKLTVHVGRRERAGGGAAHAAVVALLHRRGVAGASVLLGVDGTVAGARRRATFLGRNAEVPLMVVAVGDGDRIAALLPELAALLPRPLMTLTPVRVCKRDGVRLGVPADVTATGTLQKLVVHAGEQSRHKGRPLAGQLVRALREAGAAGATSLRGIWGYHGEHAPHGDTLWQLRRHVPVLTTVIDTPDRARDWWAIVDAHTDETGLVTSELVPGVRAAGSGDDGPPLAAR